MFLWQLSRPKSLLLFQGFWDGFMQSLILALVYLPGIKSPQRVRWQSEELIRKKKKNKVAGSVHKEGKACFVHGCLIPTMLNKTRPVFAGLWKQRCRGMCSHAVSSPWTLRGSGYSVCTPVVEECRYTVWHSCSMAVQFLSISETRLYILLLWKKIKYFPKHSYTEHCFNP